MHMPNEVVGPAMAAAGYAVSAAAVGYSAYRLREEGDRKSIPMLSVLAAFVFAAQMVNFPVGPSSGHLGGGILLAALLGPYAAVLGMSAVLIIQCLLYADGGLLALGINIFNMGVVPALIYAGAARICGGALAERRGLRVGVAAGAAYLAVMAGAALVPFEVSYSKVEMPFATFLGLMLGIHALIGVGEAVITAAVTGVLVSVKPEAFDTKKAGVSLKALGGGVLVAALFVGAVVSNFASSMPDGLEASIEKARAAAQTGVPPQEARDEQGGTLPTALMPDYTTPRISSEAVSTGVAGFVGTLITFAITFALLKLVAFIKDEAPEQPESA